MRRNKYPLTFEDFSERTDYAIKVFESVKPHKKECFIGVCTLEGSFMCDDPKSIYETLSQGERLELNPEPDSALALPRLEVRRADKTKIGMLPFADAVLPNMLLKRGLSVWCYFEASRFNSELLEIAVSIYCPRY